PAAMPVDSCKFRAAGRSAARAGSAPLLNVADPCRWRRNRAGVAQAGALPAPRLAAGRLAQAGAAGAAVARDEAELPPATEPQHLDLDAPADALAGEDPDQVVGSGDRQAVERDDHVAGHQPGLGRP